MRVLKSSATIDNLYNLPEKELLEKIERVARTCYKSENNITEDSAAKMVRNLIKSGHLAMLEHATISVRVVCDRGVSHEIVRHRMASYAQESTRYCNYAKEKFGGEISVIDLNDGFPEYNEKDRMIHNIWESAMKSAEEYYLQMLDFGATPQMARSVLPTSTKTEIVMTYNIREWYTFFKLRMESHAHPQMIEVATKIYNLLSENYPKLFNKEIKKELFDEV